MQSDSQGRREATPPNEAALRPNGDPGYPADGLTAAMLLNSFPDAAILTDPGFYISAWNPAAEALYGWPAAETLGRPAAELLGAERAQVEAHLREQSVWKGEVRHHRHDGGALAILATVSRVCGPDGEPIGLLWINRPIDGRERAEATLREREQQLSSVIESIDARIWSLDRDLRLLGGNAYFQRTVQDIAGRELAPGESIWAVPMPQEWRDLWGGWYQRALAGETFSVERRAGGATMMYRFMPIQIETGEIRGVTAVGIDVTAHVQALSAAQEAERKLGTLIDVLPLGISILDAEGKVVYANPAFSRILRLDRGDLAQQAYRQRGYLRGDGTPMPAEEFASTRALREQRPISDVETGIVTEAGELIWANVSAVPVDFPDWRVLVASVDITKRKRAQKVNELLYSASQLLARPLGQDEILDTLLDVLQQLVPYDSANIMLPESPDTLCVRYLRGYEAWTDPELVKGMAFELQKVPLIARISASRRSLLIADTSQEPTWAPLPGTSHVGCWMGVPLIANSSLLGIFSIDRHEAGSLSANDIWLAETLAASAAVAIERAQLIAQLREERALLARRVEERTADLSLVNAELVRANRLKDEFLASMSHELRTPLNAILGLSEAMQEAIYGPVTAGQIASLQNIEESGRHLLTLINDILDLSKIESGRLDLELAPLQVDLLCPLCLRMVAQAAVAKHISLGSVYDGRAQTLVADERRLKQILVNLLSNAVKFTPEGGRVGLDVRADVEQQTVTFTVWDSGIGIAAEDMPKLFKPFVQLDSSLSRSYSGTGLGLSLVARLAKAHGGSVAVESTPGLGSRFHVTLPWQPGALSASTAPETTARPTVRPAIRRAMVVEDSPATAEQLVRYLNELGARTEVLAHGVGVVERAVELQPDVILLDILLPEDDGWQVLRQLKAEPRTRAIPVIVVSVVDQPERARSLGAAAALLKPIDRATLEQALHSVIAPTEDAAIQTAIIATSVTERPTLLLAEDNEANIITMSDFLSAKGYNLIVARNGREAIARAQEERPDVILMDIQMPEVDGLEAIRRIRAEGGPTRIPIIALTALAMPGDRERCLDAGADDYLTKPVHLRGLAARIEVLRSERSDPRGPA